MAILDDIKKLLRINNAAFDTEVSDLIAAARQDLILSGVIPVKAQDDTDPLIKRALSTYVKANFGWDNPDAEKLQQSYSMLKMHLSLSKEYTGFTVTFTLTAGVALLENAFVTFDGETDYTNVDGQVSFKGVGAGQNQKYSVSLSGYREVLGEVDVTGNVSISVSMVVV